MKVIDILQKFWIPERATLIYISLLEIGPGHISDIAARIGLHRAHVYRFLPFLEEKWLVSSYMTGKIRFYQAHSPENLRYTLQSMEYQLQWAIRSLQMRQKKSDTSIFEHKIGIEAIRWVYIQQIERAENDETIYGYSSRKSDFPEDLLPKKIRQIRKEKRLARKLIANTVRASKKTHDPLREIVAIPEKYDAFEYQISKSIQGDTVSIINFDTLETFTIQNAAFAQFERKIFELLFSKLHQ